MKKRILSALLAAALLSGGLPGAFAANDISNHWAQKYITYLNEEGVMNPSASTGNYSPDEKVTRAEFMRYLNRAFHFTEKADITYTDVKSSDWYYETVQIAEKYGYIAGVGDNKMNPEGYVTREQAATIIGRLYKTAAADTVTPNQLTFTDKAKVNTWSAGYIYDAVQKGYIVGYPDGTFKPGNTVTRAEVSRILYSYLGNSLSTQSKNYQGTDFRNDVENTTISEGCTLSNAEVGGDLYITEGVGSAAVMLSDVTIDGTLIISGGNVTLENVDAPIVMVSSSMNRLVQVTTTGNTNISATTVKSTASLSEAALDVSAGGFSDIALQGGDATTLALSSDIWTLDMQSPSTVSLADSARINTLNMSAGGTVSGYGIIDTANITANGANIGIQPGNYTLGSGITATINGKRVKSDTEVVVTPGSLSWDKGSTKNLSNSYDFKLSADPKTLNRVTLDGKDLSDGTDYRATEDGFRLYRTFLSTLSEGTYALDLTFSDDSKGRLSLVVSDSSKNSMTPDSITYDKYSGSADNKDAEFYLATASGAQINNVKISGTALTRGEDYTYNGSTGVLAIKSSYLAKRSVGTATVTIEFSVGNNLTAQLTVKDSTPVNALSSTELDFDANKSSSDYEDLSVNLTMVDGAQLKSITAVGANKNLDEDWQYTISSAGEVRINRSALASLATEGRTYIDLRFNMSSGISPVLRINYVTTYQVAVTVTDDLGQPIRNASVNLSPDASGSDKDSDNSSASPAQEKLTDSSGAANFFVKKGNYTLKIQGNQFDTVTRSVRVSSINQNVKVSVGIKEEVTIAVTASSGANISGATVALGNQTKTTGADGLATFEIEHGTYTMTVTAPGYPTYSNNNFKVTSSITQRVKMGN